MVRIEKSACGQVIRITIDGQSTVMTIQEWSHALGNAGTFRFEDPTPPPSVMKMMEPDHAH